jgi:hypothetical protein
MRVCWFSVCAHESERLRAARASVHCPERAIAGALGQQDAGDVPAVQGVSATVVKAAIAGIHSQMFSVLVL